LSDWLNQGNWFGFWLTRRLLGRADLSIVISEFNRRDAAALNPHRIVVVSNGIPDPCPDFATHVLPRRDARLAVRLDLLAGRQPSPRPTADAGADAQVLNVLYLAHATREKGVFDTIAGCQQAVARLRAAGSALQLKLTIAGDILHPGERAEFAQLLAQPDIAAFTHYVGFISGAQKITALREADVFCFPTFYENENQPVNLIEAMAFGLPILTTKWRSIPELFPANYSGLVRVRAPEELADTLIALCTRETGEGFRNIFLREFTLERHLAALVEAFGSVEKGDPSPMPHSPVPAMR
jgi:glycosyltransferase involved in cell wall biosynthesis